MELPGSLLEWVSESICKDCGSVLTPGINCRVRLKHRSSGHKKTAKSNGSKKYRNEVVSGKRCYFLGFSDWLVLSSFLIGFIGVSDWLVLSAFLIGWFSRFFWLVGLIGIFDRRAVFSVLATLSRFCIPPPSLCPTRLCYLTGRYYSVCSSIWRIFEGAYRNTPVYR